MAENTEVVSKSPNDIDGGLVTASPLAAPLGPSPMSKKAGAILVGKQYAWCDHFEHAGSEDEGEVAFLRKMVAQLMDFICRPGKLPSYKKGTKSVPKTGPAILHKGEAVIPAPPVPNPREPLMKSAIADSDKEPEHNAVTKQMLTYDDVPENMRQKDGSRDDAKIGKSAEDSTSDMMFGGH